MCSLHRHRRSSVRDSTERKRTNADIDITLDRYGWCVTRKTGNCAGNSIFLPLAGFCGSGGKDGADAVAYFWSSSIDPKVYPHTPSISLDKRYAYFMCFFAGSGSSPVFDTIDRYTGLSIRPVCDL